MSNVKIVKTKSGMFKMEASNSVATFEQFRKSPDQYTKGTSANGTAEIKSQAGDKDYKQFIVEGKTLSFDGFVKMQRILENEEQSEMLQWLDNNGKLDDYNDAVHARDWVRMQDVIRPYYLEQQNSQQYVEMTGLVSDEEIPSMGGEHGIPYDVLDSAPDASVAARVQEESQVQDTEDNDDPTKKEDTEDTSQDDMLA